MSKKLIVIVYDSNIGCWLRNISLRHSCKREKNNQGISLYHPRTEKKKEKELALVSKPVTQSSITSFITKEGTVKTGLGGCLSLCYQIIHLFHGPQKQNRLQLCLLTVPLPNNFHWEKPNVPIT